MKDYVLDAALSLRRNYEDLPFNACDSEETARRVQDRALSALERSGDTYLYQTVAVLSREHRERLEEKRLLSPEAADAAYGAVYLRADERMCVETAGEDHLILTGYDESGDLDACLSSCRAVEEQMMDTGPFAHSARYGYLTSRPCDAGTGMRASLLVHIPMIILIKQLPAAVKLAGASGMTLQAAGQGICRLENRVTAGQDASRILERLRENAGKICALEHSLRLRARERQDINVMDQIVRAKAVAKAALRMGRGEAMRIWSMLTLGMETCDAPCSADQLDRIWYLAHLSSEVLEKESGTPADVERAGRIRNVFAE